MEKQRMSKKVRMVIKETAEYLKALYTEKEIKQIVKDYDRMELIFLNMAKNELPISVNWSRKNTIDAFLKINLFARVL